jgi:hypothetical protein
MTKRTEIDTTQWASYMATRVASTIKWLLDASEQDDEDGIARARPKLTYLKNKLRFHLDNGNEALRPMFDEVSKVIKNGNRQRA